MTNTDYIPNLPEVAKTNLADVPWNRYNVSPTARHDQPEATRSPGDLLTVKKVVVSAS